MKTNTLQSQESGNIKVVNAPGSRLPEEKLDLSDAIACLVFICNKRLD